MASSSNGGSPVGGGTVGGAVKGPIGTAALAANTWTYLATTYDGERGAYEATAYPLFGASGEMHGVISVFWPDDDNADGGA